MSKDMIKVDTREIDRLARSLRRIPRGITKVAVQSINRTMPSTRAEIVRLVRGDYNIPAKAVRQAADIKKASWGDPRGQLLFKESPGIPLIQFVVGSKRAPSTRRLKSGAYRPVGGISVMVSRARGKQVAGGVFIARMRSGHVGAFKRGISSGRRLSSLGKRFIREVYGPSATYILQAGKYDDKVGEHMDKTFAKNFVHNAKRTIERSLR